MLSLLLFLLFLLLLLLLFFVVVIVVFVVNVCYYFTLFKVIDIDSKIGDVVILVDEETKNHKAHAQTILDESKQSAGKANIFPHL